MVPVDVDVIPIATCVGDPSVGIRGGNDQDRGCAQSVGELACLGEGEVAQELERSLASCRLVPVLRAYDEDGRPCCNLIIGSWLRMGDSHEVDRATVDRRPDLGNSDSVGFRIDRGQKCEFFWKSCEPYTAPLLEPGYGRANFFGHFFGWPEPMVRAPSEDQKKADHHQGRGEQ